jgi:hypothetical protein
MMNQPDFLRLLLGDVVYGWKKRIGGLIETQ